MNKPNNMRRIYFPERITQSMLSIFDYPLVIVEAPMGYGKTTAVREHLGKTAGRLLWLRVYDSSNNSFWNGFCNLFAELDADIAANLAQLGVPNDNTSRQEALKLLEEIDLPEKTVLVIDDYHLIGGTNLDNFMEFLAVNEIENLHIVLIVRFSDLPNREELLLKGSIKQITKGTFEFKPKEIKNYYKLCGHSIQDDKADKLYSFTEGWISALYLLMLNYKDIDTLVTAADIYKLIEKAVYAPLPEDTKEFLLTMCIFDRFTLEQAIYMWGNETAEAQLEKVISKNAFVNYDERTMTYQIHTIFTNYLKDIKKSNIDWNDIYERAAKWYMKTGDYFTAMHYFYLCADFDGLLAALEIDRGDSFSLENLELFIKYMEECPSSLKAKRHILMLTYAMQLFLCNEIVLFGKACGNFNRNLHADDELNPDLKNELLGEYELLMSFTAYNDINKMSEHHKNACKLLTHPTSIYDTKNSWTFDSPSVLYLFYRESGKLSQHVKDIIEAMPYYYQLTDGHGSGAEYVMEGERYFNAGDIENAEISMHKAFSMTKSNRITDIRLCAQLLQMRIAFMKGDFTNLLELLDSMRRSIISKHEFFYIHVIEISEGFIYSLLKQRDKVPERVAKGDLSSSRLMFPAFGMLNIVYGRVLLINGEYLKLIGSCEHFIAIASVFSNLLGQIYTYIYLAAANKQIFREEDAASALVKALDIAMPDKVYMPFVENGDYVKPILERLYRDGRYHEDIARILELFEIYHKSFEKMTKEYFSAEEKPELTDREMEIALLAAEGLTNKEIGERLFISANTVKTALKGVFEKLNVKSRALLKQSMEN
jgi:LuxR family transcriptional regulator, maltose regulon positive regulatory protein